MQQKTVMWRLIILSLLFLCMTAAKANYYAGAMISATDADYRASDILDDMQFKPYLLQGQLGYFFNANLGIEMRYAIPINEHQDLKLNTLVSAYGRLNLPVTPQLSFYGLAGYSYLEINQELQHQRHAKSLSFGLGGHYALDRKTAITIEIVDFSTNDFFEMSAISFGVQYKF